MTSTEKRYCQEAPTSLVDNLQFDIAGIGELFPQLLNRRKGFGLGGVQIGKFDALVILVNIVTVPDIEEKTRHGLTLDKREMARKRV